MAKKRPRKTSSEEWAEYDANTKRLYELAEKAVADLGMTRQELFAKLGLPDSDPRTA
jgi:uncharacterized protein YjiS (DUF1127 family)